MTGTAPERPRHVWGMGLSNSAYGFSYAGVLVTMPQVMAAHGVGEPEIARQVFLAGLASLMTFAVAPILDTLVSRQAWARGLGITVAVLTAILLAVPPTGPWVGPFMMADALTLVMLTTALGGWLGAALPKDQDDTIGAWFTIGNGVGFGIGAFCQYQLITRLPAPAGQIMVGVIALAPILLQRLIPSPDSGLKAVRESFGDLVRDISMLVRQPRVLRITVMLALPCAAFTLTNALGGWGAISMPRPKWSTLPTASDRRRSAWRRRCSAGGACALSKRQFCTLASARSVRCSPYSSSDCRTRGWSI